MNQELYVKNMETSVLALGNAILEGLSNLKEPIQIRNICSLLNKYFCKIGMFDRIAQPLST